MRLLELRFFRVPDKPRAWYAPIIWWELRRIPYNAIVFVSMLMGLVGFVLTVEGWFDFITPPLFPVLITFFLSNMFYTGGWIVEVILRVVFRYKGTKFASHALVAGIAFSIIVAFVPAVVGLVALVSSNKIVSEYAKFTQVRPAINDLVGEYELVGRGRSYLDNSPDSLRQPKIIIYEDGNFEYFEIPWTRQDALRPTDPQLIDSYNWRFTLPRFYFELSEAKFLSGEGYWELKDGGALRAFSTWRLYLSFLQPPGFQHLSDRIFFGSPSYRFDIQHDQTPHDLYYVMGDYDSMEGMVFRKVDSSP